MSKPEQKTIELSLHPCARIAHYRSEADNRLTTTAYAGHRDRFLTYLDGREPTSSAMARYLTSLADRGMSVSTIDQCVAAFTSFYGPPAEPEYLETLAGIRRVLGRDFKRGKLPLTIPLVRELLAAIELHSTHQYAALRDCAMIAVSFTCALRGSEAVKIKRADFSIVAGGGGWQLEVVRKGGKRQTLVIPTAEPLQTVARLEAWQHELGERLALFPTINKGGNLGTDKSMTYASYNRMLKRALSLVGLDSRSYGTHSLRSGFITSADQAGASLGEIQQVTGHSDLGSLQSYLKASQLESHPSNRFNGEDDDK